MLGEKHPTYATNLINLVSLYDSQVEYLQAEPLYRQAIVALAAKAQTSISLESLSCADLRLQPETIAFLMNCGRFSRDRMGEHPSVSQLRRCSALKISSHAAGTGSRVTLWPNFSRRWTNWRVRRSESCWSRKSGPSSWYSVPRLST